MCYMLLINTQYSIYRSLTLNIYLALYLSYNLYMYDSIDHKWFVTRVINGKFLLVNVTQAND